MIKLKLTMVLLILALVSNAQNVPVTWKKDFTGAIKWQKVSALGHYLVGTVMLCCMLIQIPVK